MSELSINAELFWSRLYRLYAAWTKSGHHPAGGESWKDVASWFFVVGKTEGDNAENIGELLTLYLLGFTFTDTLVLFTKKELVVHVSGKKLKMLEDVIDFEKNQGNSDKMVELRKQSGLSNDFHVKVRLIEKNNKTVDSKFDDILAIIEKYVGKGEDSKSKSLLGFPMKDKLEGKFGEPWIDTVKAKFSNDQLMNIGPLISALLVKKDEIELDYVRKSAQLTTRVMKYACVKRMEDIIDEDEKVKQSDLAREIEGKIKDPAKVRSKLLPDHADSLFQPIVQSGMGSSSYDFKLDAASSDKHLSFDDILFAVGVRYHDYCTYMARTFLVGPNKQEETIYNTLVKVFDWIIDHLKPGAQLSSIHSNVLKIVKDDDASLIEYLTKECGWEIGLSLRNKHFIIEAETDAVIEADMTFCVRVGFLNVPVDDKRGKLFSCLLGDTVSIGSHETERLTKFNYKYSEIIYEIEESDEDDEEDEVEDDDEDNEKPKKKKKKADDDIIVVGENKIQRSLRSAHKTASQLERETNFSNMDSQITAAQKQLMIDKADRERRKWEEGENDNDGDESRHEINKYYKSPADYPKELRKNQIYCDPDHEMVFLPIYGCHVPFHITTIKTVAKSDEENATLLRINFFYPTSIGGASSFSKDISREMRAVIEQHPDLAYVKEMSFRSKDPVNLTNQLRLIKELQKKVRAREKKKEQEADLVEQADLILDQAGKKPRLSDISMKPPLRKGKCVGSLAAHVNGFRFRTVRGETFDLIYSNIKHFIFQPCENELIVLIHFHLKNPVMVGQKTKTKDVQFYAEVVEGSTALDSHKRQMYDPDEIDEEYRERQLRKRLNQAFKSFCDQVIQVCERSNINIGQNNEYDMPYRALGFNAVPHKEMVFMQPTVHCLVNLTETPFFVISLDEIEHIHFERTDFRVSKTFDMVFILKKHLLPDCDEVPERLQSIPVDKFETIKQWIHEKGDITFTCGTTPLAWKTVMIGVREELEARIFWDEYDLEGNKKPIGWNFLALEDTAESGEENNEEDEEDSAFEIDSEDEEAAEESSEDSDEEDWEDEDESSDVEEGSEEEGEDWDELERQAVESDRQRTKREREVEEITSPPKHKDAKRRKQ